MNKEEMIELLKTDVEGWNEFRTQIPKKYINLMGADLSDLNLKGADLSSANLQNANLQRTQFFGALFSFSNLQYAKLHGADLDTSDFTRSLLVGACFDSASLRNAKFNKTLVERTSFINSTLTKTSFVKTELNNANFQNAYLWGTDFRHSKHSKTNFRNADLAQVDFRDSNLDHSSLKNTNLKETKFQRCHLQYTNFDKAKFNNTSFSSRSQLNDIQLPLTETQITNCIFEDEQKFYEKQAKEKTRNKSQTFNFTPLDTKYTLTIHYKDHTSWTPRDMSLLLMAIQSSYSNLLYLKTTTETAIDIISNRLGSIESIYPPLEQEICIKAIQSGSLNILIDFLSSPEGQLTTKTIVVPTTLVALGKFLHAISKIVKDSSETYKSIVDSHNSKKITDAECRLKNAQAHEIEIKNQISNKDERQITNHERQSLDERLSGNSTFNELVDQFTSKNPALNGHTDLTHTALKPLKNAALTIAKTGKTTPK